MNVISYKFLPHIVVKSVDSIIDRIQPNSCYKNAFYASAIDYRTNYVLGMAYIPLSQHDNGFLPIEHAWNEFDGKHFDLTSEIIFKDLSNFSRYEEAERLTREELFDYLAQSNGVTPDLFHYKKYRTNKINKMVEEFQAYHYDNSSS